MTLAESVQRLGLQMSLPCYGAVAAIGVANLVVGKGIALSVSYRASREQCYEGVVRRAHV
jgi:hypothetical protein